MRCRFMFHDISVFQGLSFDTRNQNTPNFFTTVVKCRLLRRHKPKASTPLVSLPLPIG